MDSRFISVLVLLFLFSSVASAQQICKWKDNKGQWHFSDHPPAEVRAEKVRGIDIGPIPPMPPQIAEPPIPSGGSESTEQTVSKPRLTEEVSREQRVYLKRLEDIIQQIKALKKRMDVVSSQLHMGLTTFKEKLAPGETITVHPGLAIERKSPTRSIVPRDSSKERELSRLGNQLDKLYQKRDKLIQEMRQKGFETGYIPY